MNILSTLKLFLVGNPCAKYLRWLIERWHLLRVNPTLRLDRMSWATKCRFGKYVSIKAESYLYEVSIGNYSYVSELCKIHKTVIGNFCSIASGVRIGLGIHPVDLVSTSPVFYSNQSIIPRFKRIKDHGVREYAQVSIGNDVWIGVNAVIRDGVTIGDGAVIGAGAVVTRDIPPYAVVGGVPARIIKYRFPLEQIDRLLATKWWNLPDKKLQEFQPLFGRDIEAFLGAMRTLRSSESEFPSTDD